MKKLSPFDRLPPLAAMRKLFAAAGLLLLVGCASPQQTSDPMFDNAMPAAYIAPPQKNGAIYQAGHDLAFFEDLKARRVGDIITVLLSEQTQAEKSSGTSLDRTSSTNVINPTVFGSVPGFGSSNYNLNLDLDSQHDFSGSGNSNQSNRLSGSISVTVAQVLPNGNLVIQGEKWIEINQGEEFIRLRGIVRPIDVSTSNTVLSTQVADARISYSGKGQMADTNRMGWLARFFLGPLWPF